MPTRNVFLTEHFDNFIASGVETGRYSNASEVVREGLRLLEQHEAEDRARIAWLRNSAEEGAHATLDFSRKIERSVGDVHAEVERAKPTGKIEDFLGLLAGKTAKVATLEELEQAAADGWAGKRRSLVDSLSMPGLAAIEFDPPRLRDQVRPADFS